MADNDTLARPYAQAAFAVASESDSLAPMSAALQAAGVVVRDPQVAGLIDHPAVSPEQLLGILQGVFADIPEAKPLAAAGGNGENLLKLLIENDRLALLPVIAEQVELLKRKAEQIVNVTITAASAIDDSQKNEIAEALKSRLGRNVDITTEVDEGLIGGAVIRAGDFVIDGSVRSKLSRMSAVLQK